MPTQTTAASTARKTLRDVTAGQPWGPYRGNIFRVLSIPVDVEPEAVRNREKHRLARLAAGHPLDESNGVPLALKPAPDANQRKDALDRLLTKPLEQLVHELFWLWPTPEHDGRVLCSPELSRAVEHWRSLVGKRNGHGKLDSRAGIAAHNLAIWHHTLALDSEFHFLQNGGQPHKDRIHHWDQAFHYWHRVISNDGLLDYMERRIGELDDPTVTVDTAVDVLADLPDCLLQINVSLASEALRRGRSSDARWYIDQLRKSPFSQKQKDAAVRAGADAAGEEIKRLCKTAAHQAKSDPQHAGQFIRRLHKDLATQLEIIDVLLPASDIKRSGLHDLAATTLLDCINPFADHTAKWQEAQQLVELAAALATGVTVRDRVTKLTETLSQDAKSLLHWCLPGYWELPVATVEALEVIREDGNKKNWAKAIAAIEDLILVQADETPENVLAVLHHCLAFCLCRKGIELFTSMMNVEDEAAKILNTTLEKLLALDEDEIHRRIASIDEARSGFQIGVSSSARCFCCNLRIGDSLVVIKQQNIPLLFCRRCASKVEAAQDRVNAVRKDALRDTATYSVVANDFSPHDPAISKDFEQTKSALSSVGQSMPDMAKAAKLLKLRVAPPTLRQQWKRAQQKAREELARADELRQKMNQLCQSMRSPTPQPARALALAWELSGLMDDLHKIRSAESVCDSARLMVAEALLALDQAVSWDSSRPLDRVKFLEAAQEIAGDSTARANVDAVLGSLKSLAARLRRRFKVQLGLAGSLAAAAVGLGWFIVTTLQP